MTLITAITVIGIWLTGLASGVLLLAFLCRRADQRHSNAVATARDFNRERLP